MTELEYRKKVVASAMLYSGVKQGSLDHKSIIDTYNSITPLPRGYKAKYDDAWCAIFISAIAKKLEMLDIIPAECSAVKMVELFKGLNCWVENDAYSPKIGDIIFYNWNDGPNYEITNCTENPSHVGIVVSATGNGYISVIEGNNGTDHRVGIRVIRENGRYIRGFATPDYKSLVKADANMVIINAEMLRNGSKSSYVKTLQSLLNKEIKSNLTVDGNFGPKTENYVKKYQKSKGLEVDGIVGKNTWNSLLKYD